jgi:hypothetical protein
LQNGAMRDLRYAKMSSDRLAATNRLGSSEKYSIKVIVVSGHLPEAKRVLLHFEPAAAH